MSAQKILENKEDQDIQNLESQLQQESLKELEQNKTEQEQKEKQKEELSRLLKQELCFCFHQEDIQIFEQEFKQLKERIQKVFDENNYECLDEQYFLKFTNLCQLKNPLKIKRVVEMFLFSLSTKQSIEQLCSLALKKRFIVDLLNSFFNMMEKFQFTYLEWNLKVLFYKINENLSHYEAFSSIVQMISEQGYKLLEEPQLSVLQQTQLKKIQESSKIQNSAKKNEAVTQITLLLGKCNSIEEQYYIFTTILPPILNDLMILPEDISIEGKSSLLSSLMYLIERYVFTLEFNIQLETVQVQGVRTYFLKTEISYLEKHPLIYFPVATVLNEILILPNEISLQVRAFSVIRRLYNLFPQNRKLFFGPIVVCLSNIALFSKTISQEKEATIFLYKILQNNETDPLFVEQLNSNEYIQKLKENKYYSVKALSYPNDDDIIVKFKSFNLQIMFPLFKLVDAGSFFCYNVCVQKPSTIIYWSFKTVDFDIHFGLYRIESLEDFQIEDFKNENKCRAIIKLQKSDSNKENVIGFSFINVPGYYKLVFDNSYSYFRSKELYYSIHVLEGK